MSQALDAWNRLKPYTAGRWLFSRVVCFRAPYFASIRPRFVRLGDGKIEVSMKKRRRVTNHIGTVHAIAMANLCELAAGTMIEALLDRSLRWIPKGMDIQYLAKAGTDVTARASMPAILPGEAQDAVISVSVTDRNGVEVVAAAITM
ncbi:MAG: hotdog fold domain-containing protein, partial [Woeseiaceae bacterium]